MRTINNSPSSHHHASSGGGNNAAAHEQCTGTVTQMIDELEQDQIDAVLFHDIDVAVGDHDVASDDRMLVSVDDPSPVTSTGLHMDVSMIAPIQHWLHNLKLSMDAMRMRDKVNATRELGQDRHISMLVTRDDHGLANISYVSWQSVSQRTGRIHRIDKHGEDWSIVFAMAAVYKVRDLHEFPVIVTSIGTSQEKLLTGRDRPRVPADCIRVDSMFTAALCGRHRPSIRSFNPCFVCGNRQLTNADENGDVLQCSVCLLASHHSCATRLVGNCNAMLVPPLDTDTMPFQHMMFRDAFTCDVCLHALADVWIFNADTV